VLAAHLLLLRPAGPVQLANPLAAALADAHHRPRRRPRRRPARARRRRRRAASAPPLRGSSAPGATGDAYRRGTCAATTAGTRQCEKRAAGSRLVQHPRLRAAALQVSAQSRSLLWHGRGELLWRHDGERYDAKLEVSAPCCPHAYQQSDRRASRPNAWHQLRFSDKSRTEFIGVTSG
jgi:hypothetical protein